MTDIAHELASSEAEDRADKSLLNATASHRSLAGRRALVGCTGFVGTSLLRATTFDAGYNSRNLGEIRGQRFDTVVCAAAPATMWAANADPDADRRNIDQIVDLLASAIIGRLVLVSTIAVLGDADAGYDEETARYEIGKAYGRNRRMLEQCASDLADEVHILRLPALFGEGLKKNFLFDILNPVPSFLKKERFDALTQTMSDDDAALARRLFVFNDTLGMLQFQRDCPTAEGARVASAFGAAGFSARDFTNSDSRFQFYSLDRLWSDIGRCVDADIGVLNVASEPLRAGDVYKALTGVDFVNPGPPVYREDMHSRHAGLWGKEGPYLYSAGETLSAISAFAARMGRS